MNLLSLRGGSARGIISLLLLIEIVKRTGKPIHELFDFVGASSVGTMIVSSLLVSEDAVAPIYTPDQVYELFLKHVYNSFSWTYYSYVSTLFGLIGPKYTTCGLYGIINDCCKQYTLKNLLKPIIFPAYDRVTNTAFYFDKDKHETIQLSDTIMACTAIPTYFDSHKMTINERQYDFLDSAIVTNDPSQLVLLKATCHLKSIDKSKIFLLNIGTGYFPNTINDKNGLLGWLPNIVNTLLNGSESNELYQLHLSLPSSNYYVLDIPLNQFYYPDDIRKETIHYYITETNQWIKDNDHILSDVCEKLLKNKQI